MRGVPPAIPTGISSTRARYKKLNFRATLQILHEADLDIQDDDAGRTNAQKAETGVEKSEEGEFHLQAALRSQQAAAVGDKFNKADIPVRKAVPSELDYDKYYPSKYQQPATNIRFSSTVEDCIGCPYDLDEEDDHFLTSLNKTRKDGSAPCSELDFEQVIFGFETAAAEKQPYAAVDGGSILSFEEMEVGLEEWIDEHRARSFAKDIYPHWKTKRQNAHNRPLLTSLKVETGADTDEADPYVCFRRRELRQTRKTRGRDAHSAEKLKKLRKELEDGRELLALIKQRESIKQDQLAVDKKLFEDRVNLRSVKQNLPDQYKAGDDELLVTQKKKKPIELNQRQGGQQLRLPQRADGRSAEDQLITLEELLAKQHKDVDDQIEAKIAVHRKWNEGWVDGSTDPLTPPPEVGAGSTFRTATTEYISNLPTPPLSVSSKQSGDIAVDAAHMNGKPDQKDEPVVVRYASPSYDGPTRGQPSFRKRIGRGGRLWIDRRGKRSSAKDDKEESISDRYKFDDDDEEEETPTYLFNPYDGQSLHFRAAMLRGLQGLRRPPEGTAANSQGSAASTTAG